MWDLLKKLILILARFSGIWGWSNSGGTFERPVFNSKQICWLYLASARQRTYLIYVYNDMDSFELYYVKPWGSPPLPPRLRGTPCLRQKTKNLLQGCTSQPASNCVMVSFFASHRGKILHAVIAADGPESVHICHQRHPRPRHVH